MPARISFHGRDTLAINNGLDVVVLGRQVGDAQALAISGTKANSAAAPCDGWVRIVATEAFCAQIGVADAVHNANSPYYLANTETVRAVKEGDIISVVASA